MGRKLVLHITFYNSIYATYICLKQETVMKMGTRYTGYSCNFLMLKAVIVVNNLTKKKRRTKYKYTKRSMWSSSTICH